MMKIFRGSACVLLGIAACSCSRLSFADNLLASWVDAPAPKISRVEIYHDSTSKIDLDYSDVSIAVAIDPNGNLYVGSYSSAQIKKYSSAGLPQGTFATAPRPLFFGGIAFNAAGRLFVAALDLSGPSPAGSIEHFAADGAPLGIFASVSPSLYDVAINKVGQTYLSVGSSIQRFDSDGTLLDAFLARGRVNTLSLDGHGNVYAIIDNSSVVAFTGSGAPLGTVVSGLGLIQSIAVDASDTLYVGGGVESQSQGFIKKYSTNGTFLGDFVIGQPGIPYDLAFAAPVPEPSAFPMIAILGGCVLAFGRALFGSS